MIWGKTQIKNRQAWWYPFLSLTWALQNLSILQFPTPSQNHYWITNSSWRALNKAGLNLTKCSTHELLPQHEPQSSNVRGVMAAGPAEHTDLHQHLKVTFILHRGVSWARGQDCCRLYVPSELEWRSPQQKYKKQKHKYPYKLHKWWRNNICGWPNWSNVGSTIVCPVAPTLSVPL